MIADHFIERIEHALETCRDCPWLADLTIDLVKAGWRTLHQETGLSSCNYGTFRVVARNARASRYIVGYLSTSSGLEIIDQSHYEDAGVEFYTAGEIACAGILRRLEDAIALLRAIPTLNATVGALVRSFHVIKPKDDEHDVSFSEPHIPFSIFISVPRKHMLDDALRVSEAIIHESMHLQLTLIEQKVALIDSKPQRYYSPWKRARRDAQGILHALYVFRVIDRALEQLASTEGRRGDVTEYVDRRRSDIDRQMREIRSFQHCSGLTSIGTRFVKALLR